MAGNPAQVHPIHIHLDSFLAYFFGVCPRFGLWRVLDLAEHAAIALAACLCFSSAILPLRSVTFWTCNHPKILPDLTQILSTLQTHYQHT